MTSSAFWAYGSTIQLGDGAGSEAFTSIAEVMELEFLNMKRESIDVTSHSSSDGYREKIPGIRDAGSVAIKANWLPTNATQDGTTGVLECFNDNTNHNWKIIAPSTLVTISFSGHVTEFKAVGGTVEDQGQLEFTVEISGKPTVA